MTTNNEITTIVEVDQALDSIAQKVKDGGITLAEMMALASQAENLGKERNALTTKEVTVALGAIKVTIPKDITVRFTMKKDAKGDIMTTASIGSPTIMTVIQAAIGKDLMDKIRSTDAIKGITWIDGVVTLNGATTKVSNGGNGSNGSRAMTVDGVWYPSAASAYRGAMGQDKPYEMSGDAIEKVLEKAGHSIG